MSNKNLDIFVFWKGQTMKHTIITALMAIMLLTATCQATDIFGSGREFSVTYGDSVAVAHYGFVPLPDQQFSWGLAVSTLLKESEIDDTTKADEWLAGLYVEHPLITFDGVDSLLPDNLTGEIFGGCELQYLLGTNEDTYFTPYVGVEVQVSENVLIRTDWRYNKRNSLLDEHILSIGVCVHW